MATHSGFRKGRWFLVFMLLMLVLPAWPPVGYAQSDSYTASETGKTIRGRFLRYWFDNGDVHRQGLPISEEMTERSDTNGKVYTVQYFERAVLELHTENQAPYDVLLSLLGVFRYKAKYAGGAPDEAAIITSSHRAFPETGKHVGCEFLDYWLANGGVAQLGYPISDQFTEVSDLDGQAHPVQYFQRAVLELHAEDEPPNRILSLPLGTLRYMAKNPEQPLSPIVVPKQASANSGKCIATFHGGTTSEAKPDAPVRSSVGTGHIMKGVIKSENDCAPIAGTKIVFWLAGPDGEYDDAHRASVFTDSSGAYRFESNYPGSYGDRPVPHIHLYVSAGSFDDIETEYFPVCGETEATLDVILAHRPGEATPVGQATQVSTPGE